MEEKLRALLKKEETLLWCGRPEPFETMDQTNKKSIVIGLIIKGLIFGGMLIAYIVASLQAGGDLNPPVLVVLVVFAVFAIYYPFLTAKHLRKKFIYGLTDKRILRIGENTETVSYERIRSAALRTDEDGHTSLLCGPGACKLKNHQLRSRADAPFSNGAQDPEADDVVLYALPMDPKLRGTLKKYLPLS